MLKRFFLSSLSLGVALLMNSTAGAQVTRGEGDEKPTSKPHLEAGPSSSKPLLKIVDEVHKAITKELDLEKDQKGPVDDLFAETRARIEEHTAESGKENAERLADIREEMDKAREDKNWEKFRELTKQMREITKNQPNAVEVLRQLHETLKEILDDDQHDKLEDIFKRYQGEYESKFQEGMLKLMVLLRTMDEIDVDNDQIKDIKEFKTSFTKDMKDLDKSDPGAMERMYQEGREDLMKILHDDQVKAFEKAEAEAMESMKGHRAGRLGQPDSRKESSKAKAASPAKKDSENKAKAEPENEPEDGEAEDEEDEEDSRA